MPVKNVMISAGEASGDQHGANLVRALHAIDPTIRVTGMGSEKMQQAGVDLLYDSRDIAVVGIVEVLAKWGTIMNALNTLREAIRQNPPDLLILVDYQEFNLKLAKTAKKHGVKVMFYIGPQVWAWRSHRVKKIGQHIDMMAVLFPFEEAFYTQADVPVRYVGNPLVDEVKPSMTVDAAKDFFNLDKNKKTVGLFPGSRGGEVQRLLPILLESARLIKKQHADVQFMLPVASALNIDGIKQHLNNYAELDITLTQNKIHDVMQVCDAIITASGTASLEVALIGTPMVIIYKLSNLSYAIMSRLITIDDIGLPNIVAGERIVKEMVQDKADPVDIAEEVMSLLTDNKYRETVKANLSEVKKRLGESGGSERVAQLAYDMLYPETN